MCECVCVCSCWVAVRLCVCLTCVSVCRQLLSSSEVKKSLDHLNKQVSDMQNTLQRINAPNMKAVEK